jgi:hypothetical protein
MNFIGILPSKSRLQKKKLMEQNDIKWNLYNSIFWKDKIDHKNIMSTKINLIIITGNSAKEHRAQLNLYIYIREPELEPDSEFYLCVELELRQFF